MERLILMPGQNRPAQVPEVIRCCFNPQDITVSHDAGLAARPVPLGGIADPLQGLGYGRAPMTTLTLRLLFEGAPGAARGEVSDVRVQTRALYALASPVGPGSDAPCPVDLIWGRHWSARGTVARLSEVLDDFTAEGVATRSWVQMEVWTTDGPGVLLPYAMAGAAR